MITKLLGLNASLMFGHEYHKKRHLKSRIYETYVLLWVIELYVMFVKYLSINLKNEEWTEHDLNVILPPDRILI